ncbi:MAG TPA: gamma carbonic anhydrase family protein [Gemmataceae bacterium]|nr:gamma carbonic anhydrase family protein [Gemmataceae bacterium]
MQAIDDFYIAANAVVLGDVVLGPGANIWYGCVVRGDLARITFGPRANLQDGCIVHTDTNCPQEIEEGVVVGHAAMLHGSRIGRDSLIAIGARLLSGCEIGPECLIAAGCVVPENRRIPARSLVMGVPGKVVRTVTDEEVAKTRWINAHYVEMAARHARGEFRRPHNR